MLDGDTDLFGDGSVTLVSTPGHTPGSQSLLVHLKNSGFIILSGDVVHLEENFEKDTVPSLNTDKGASIASMDRIKQMIATYSEEFGGEVTLEITWVKAKLFPPGNGGSAGEEVTYIRVWCPDRPRLEWLLVTNLPVNNQEDSLRIVRIYRRRWLIEDYHKAVKTGFRIEDNQLKQASRILALFGMIGVIATQLLSMRERCRLSPETPVEEKVPKPWITLIERHLMVKLKTVKDFWRSLARMGGFIGRKSDGEPGWQTIWKGYKRLQDMLMGALLGCGC